MCRWLMCNLQKCQPLYLSTIQRSILELERRSEQPTTVRASEDWIAVHFSRLVSLPAGACHSDLVTAQQIRRACCLGSIEFGFNRIRVALWRQRAS